MLRTRTAGSLRASDIGQVVTLTGWVDRRRDHGGVAFIDLRDASGIAQVVIREEIAHDLRAEYVLAVTGEVSARPEGNANPNLPTGEIEVVVSDVEILNASAPLPFQVSDHAEDAGQVGEEARLRYRYLDLRRSAMQHAIRLRAKVSQAARRVRSCSSSSSWWPAWSATTRSPAATAMRTSAPTASPSSPSSTWR